MRDESQKKFILHLCTLVFPLSDFVYSLARYKGTYRVWYENCLQESFHNKNVSF